MISIIFLLVLNFKDLNKSFVWKSLEIHPSKNIISPNIHSKKMGTRKIIQFPLIAVAFHLILFGPLMPRPSRIFR